MYKAKIIIDTDIGDDIDDAFALALAVKSSELDIAGITTVFRNSVRRAKITTALLDTYRKKNIPVYAGIDEPLTARILARDNDKADEKGYLPCQFMDFMENITVEQSKHAVDFIIETIRNNPGEVVLVPIGPLTNIAVAIKKAPDIASKVKCITLMGGFFTGGFAEWNILCDPEAARIVFTCGANVNAVGLDVTLKCELLPQMVEIFKQSSSKSPKLISRMMDMWFDHYKFKNPVLHDPLTIGTIIDPSFVRFEEKSIKVILDGEKAGKTEIVEDTGEFGVSRIKVGVDVDVKRYLDFFVSRVFE